MKDTTAMRITITITCSPKLALHPGALEKQNEGIDAPIVHWKYEQGYEERLNYKGSNCILRKKAEKKMLLFRNAVHLLKRSVPLTSTKVLRIGLLTVNKPELPPSGTPSTCVALTIYYFEFPEYRKSSI